MKEDRQVGVRHHSHRQTEAGPEMEACVVAPTVHTCTATAIPSSHTMTDHIVHIWGLPWELETSEAVLSELQPLLTMATFACLKPPLLPLDKRGRPTGRALLFLRHMGTSSVDPVVALHGCQVGKRYLEARTSNEKEAMAVQLRNESIAAKMREQAPQHFAASVEDRDEVVTARTVPADPRDILLLSHETRADVASGDFDLSNLPLGRVDVLARCASAALFVSHGVRPCVRVWFMLCDAGLSLCLQSSQARGLHPDERTIAAAMRRALRAAAVSAGSAGAPIHAPNAMPAGWSAHLDDHLEARLRAILGAKGRGFLVSHELGAPLTPKLAAQVCTDAPTSLIVLGDHLGFRREEEDCFQRLGGVRASVSPVPLLASHCIVLAHAVLDAR